MRGRGEGSVALDKATGLWVGRLELPPVDGKRRRKVIRRKDKNTLIRDLNQLRTELERTGDLPTDAMTVETWFAYWMREAAKTRRPKTVESYRSIVDRWVIPTIGNVRLDRVTPATVRRVLTALEDAGRSSTYARNAHAVMTAALDDAMREGRIPRNPVTLVRAPLKAVTNLHALTPEEAIRLLSVFADSPDGYLWATFILTGARRGEVLGLEWDRVGDELDLSWQLQRLKAGAVRPADFEYRQIKGELYWTRPKTRAGWRVVPLVDPLRGILERWREQAPANPWGLVFTRQTAAHGRLPVDPDYATRLWPQILEAAGVGKHIRIHDLRHSTVDLLYAAGVPEDVTQLIVGHSSRAMTRAYKSRGDLDRVRAAMLQLSALLTG